MEKALKNAGWSDDLIKSFVHAERTVINPVSMSDYVVEEYNNQDKSFDYPQKIDSSTFVISVDAV